MRSCLVLSVESPQRSDSSRHLTFAPRGRRSTRDFRKESNGDSSGATIEQRMRVLVSKVHESSKLNLLLEELKVALEAVLLALHALVLLASEVAVAVGAVEVIAVEANLGELALSLHGNNLAWRSELE